MTQPENQSPGEPASLARYKATRERIVMMSRALGWNQDTLNQALVLSGHIPTRTQWQISCSRFLLIVGCALMLAGVASFFAFNWADLHRFAKFGLIETGILGGIVAAWRLGITTLPGKVFLFTSAFLVGTFLVVFGQTYQTGADPYGLFMAWSILILPWVLIGRQSALWMLLAVLVNLTVILYWTEIFRPPLGEFSKIFGPLIWLALCVTDLYLAIVLTLLNGIFLTVWEYLSGKDSKRPWMKVRWLPRVTATGILAVITAASLTIIFGSLEYNRPNPHEAIVLLIFALALASMVFYYQSKAIDLFILAECALSMILLITSAIARFGPLSIDFALFLSLLVIVETSLAAIWLHNISRKQESGQ
ncbi:DUF2157 domain-containing protein [Hahella sp. CCB-MM4]|uniref:DUF2157 domain-containing protein n=1 Tax=Hahella sp. (strain CCB-MM4) TaxID=1926491 RepID=UPI00113FE653|nr:DUF2157 domain-containing protein [Hahella sp. CCB-MM4]